MLTKETMKIIVLYPKQNKETLRQLEAISKLYSVSARRVIQFCLAHAYKVQSIPKPTRFYNEFRYAKTMFIPFSDKGLATLNSLNTGGKQSFKQVCVDAIDHVYKQFSSGEVLSESIYFPIYMYKNYEEDLPE